MKQILQHLNTGKMELAEVPCPSTGRGMVLIQTSRSLISAGTERMLVEFSKGNLIQKARSQPDKVKQVLDKIRTDGLMPTLEAVFRKLDEPLPLGYCNAGRVLAVGSGVQDLQPGDRVISNGNHAEIVCVPRNLVAKIPDGVSDEVASFTVLGAVALQGIRLAHPTLGERFVVFGMGLLGLMTVQLLRANGCSVVAVDVNSARLALAANCGAEIVDLSAGGDPVKVAQAWTGGLGVDGVLITASAKTDEIMHQAAEACRKRGRIVLVGVVGLNLRRDDFFKKEITFQVSCSYGPGRYDEAYEQQGQDYPLPYVRWTEGRNFEAVLGAMSSGALDIAPLITHRVPFADALLAYDKIQNDASALGVVLEYPEGASQEQRVSLAGTTQSKKPSPRPSPLKGEGVKAVVGVIGAGNFAVSTILPAIVKRGARIKYVAGNRNGAAVTHAARKFGAEQAVTDYKMLLTDPEVNTVFIVTGHNSHARLVREAMNAGKHVFVEKPLCLNEPELEEIEKVIQLTPHSSPLTSLQLMVGFNRRFSPHIERMKKALAGRSEPLTLTMTVNAGAIPPEHWTQNPEIGGGRIIGEGCHFIDLLSFLTGAPVTRVTSLMVGEGPAVREDKMSILLGFADGSVGTVHYFANGSKSFPKETVEAFSDGRVVRLENFRQTRGYGFKRFDKMKTWRQDKGHTTEIARFIDRVEQGGAPLIPFSEIVNVTRASFAAVQSARTGETVQV
jgi:predicted dehydrogenase/D-arabinose 1-dehydrogenase-like Zn-dependent alcohol dehydrogenase